MDDFGRKLETHPSISAAVLLVLVQVLLVACHVSPVTSIPLVRSDDYELYLSARVNGVKFTCWLDTGAGDRVYLERDRAIAAGIRPTTHGRTGWVSSETIIADERAKATIELGGLKLDDQEVVIQNMAVPEDCILGMGTLRQFVVELDYDAPALYLYRSAAYQRSATGDAVAFTLEDAGPVVAAIITLSNGDRIDARLVVDTGCRRSAGYLTKSFIDRHNLMGKVSKTVPYFWSDVMNNQQPKVLATRMDELLLGASKLRQPMFFLAQTRGFGGETEPYGMLCPDFMRRFKVVFDYPRHRLILDPSPHSHGELPFDASGTLIYRKMLKEAYRVFRVIEGSPAAEAGLRPGDIVLELDGKVAAQLSQHEIVKALTRAGHVCVLRIQRGADILTVNVKLRTMI